ncbi:DUF4325 domain-containing protein [Xylophilus rhododendri]|uniref:DUF4325 domain-containing protein n=1 Tax=Xylophilus rhododendri TaxID=2697032 RepID=A0A857J6V7_9BURK|nr:STAS-like domain-containing protein [Xylophilus rhododendri]QHI98518.1 DUF4325 domain-containing protein [Xylophilus rhododendri]
MTQLVSLRTLAHSRTLGSRTIATPIRAQVEAHLSAGDEVVLDFTGISITQGFADELVGGIVLAQGLQVLEKLVFKGCSRAVQQIISFVIADRAEQHQSRGRSTATGQPV